MAMTKEEAKKIMEEKSVLLEINNEIKDKFKNEKNEKAQEYFSAIKCWREGSLKSNKIL